MYSLREVNGILSSGIGDEGFRVKEGILLELSVPLKPGMCFPPQEALSGDRGPLFALGASGLVIKTCGFVVIETLHNCSVVNRDKQVPKLFHRLIC